MGRHLQSGKQGVGVGMGGAHRDSSISVLEAWGPAERRGLGLPVVIVWTWIQSSVLGWTSWCAV